MNLIHFEMYADVALLYHPPDCYIYIRVWYFSCSWSYAYNFQLSNV